MIDPDEQDELGREIVAQLGELPYYGPIVWWNNTEDGPKSIDGATREWAIDICSADLLDPYQQRYDPSKGSHYPRDTKTKDAIVSQMNLKGILGLLVVLDYRNSLASIYGREMLLKPHWFNEALKEGSYGWRKYNAPKLIENVKFKNPFLDHRSSAPRVLARNAQV